MSDGEQGNAVGVGSWSSCVYQTDPPGWYLLWLASHDVGSCAEVRPSAVSGLRHSSYRKTLMFVSGMRPWAGFRSHLAGLEPSTSVSLANFLGRYLACTEFVQQFDSRR